MNIKYILPTLLLLIFLSGCTVSSEYQTGSIMSDKTVMSSEISVLVDVEKIEVFHFHATSQCYSCVTVGNYAKETVETYFKDELESGKIIFAHVNGELQENRDNVIKYGATGSSLFIGTYTKDGQFTAEENVNVWYKISNKDDYMTYLKGLIEKRLKGDMSK